MLAKVGSAPNLGQPHVDYLNAVCSKTQFRLAKVKTPTQH